LINHKLLTVLAVWVCCIPYRVAIRGQMLSHARWILEFS